MALSNTIEFLPPVFRTPTNQRFLGATVDQLFTDPVVIPMNGYVGRRFSPTYKINDNYIPELTGQRQNYQLEPSVVVKDNNKNILFNTGYIDLINSVANNNGYVDNHQRLFSAKSYSYDGHFDYDKFVNYYNYYWLPNGPAAVPIVTNEVPYTKSFTVTRNTTAGGYNFTGVGSQPNSQLTLARGGSYTFNINQPGIKFWIQSSPGTLGKDANLPTVSTRQVFGVKNNGIDQGVITFKVPLLDSQNFYTAMPIVATVDAAVTFKYTDIQNRLLSEFLAEFPTGLDGISNSVALQGSTFAFIDQLDNANDWTTPSIPAGSITTDTNSYAPGTIVSRTSRVHGWRVSLIPTVTVAGNDYVIQISSSIPATTKQKIFVRSGKTYASNQFWINNNLTYQPVPTITATKDYLYYQDSENPEFYGQIKLVNNSNSKVDVDKDILGQIGYTSPNGVIFTNGLKIYFDRYVTPASYANKEYYVEGVGRGISLTPVDLLIVPETFGLSIDTLPDYLTINRASRDCNPWTRSNRWFHKDVVLATANYNNTETDYGPNLPGRRPILEFDSNIQLFNFGRQAKASITYITREKSAQTLTLGGHYNILSVGTTDFTSFGAATNAVGVTFIATRNGTAQDGTGTTTTDAFNDYKGKVTASIDGYDLQNNDRIVFSQDYDTTILNQIFKVVIEKINNSNYITLVPTDDTPVLAGENLLVTSGDRQGETWRFDGTSWYQCQVKTSANQEPLFDLIDADGYSFSDITRYPDTTFAGSRLFGYARGTGTADPMLGFPLKYQNFNNIGDIAFYNYYDFQFDSIGASTPATFTYTDNLTTKTINLNSGFVAQSPSLEKTQYSNNWIETVEPSAQYQIFTKFYDGTVITINEAQHAFVQVDILPGTSATVPHLKVYLNNKLLTPGNDYDLTMYGVYAVVILSSAIVLEIGDKIDVAVFSSAVSQIAYYEVPKNLDYNPLNENFNIVTLGQLRTHYNKLIENTAVTTGNQVPVQDHYLKAQSGTLLQHDAPLVYAMTFLNDPTVNFVNGLNFARKEYTKFKNRFLTLCTTIKNLDYSDPAASVDTILQNINAVKNISFPWFYSDMVPQGKEYTTITYTVLNVRQTNYEINTFFDIAKLSNRAVLVYVNNVQQSIGTDYEFSTLNPTIIFLKSLAINDVITIRDYPNTDGNYIPETPTKLGLYPKSLPQVYVDTTYQTSTEVLRGHDGSLTPTFGDFRDDFLLELELRIYNNIKSDHDKNQMDIFDVLPGRFRTTDYSLEEYNKILSQNFLTWVGNHSIDYISNKTYDVNNAWTWNYSSYGDSVDNSKLQGSWRAIYKYWYDTDTPNLTPWEMLGFFDRPVWWIDRYGVAPYTKGNSLLWEDLEAGYVWNGSNALAYTDSRFIRPNLVDFIPVDSAGNLLNPVQIPLTNIAASGQFSTAYSGADFAVGQQGPTETAWRRSSDYAYAVQLALALTKPATYFATQLDTSRFFNNSVTGQFSNIDNQKIAPSILTVNGNATSGTVQRTSGYINWIADSIKNLGIDPVAKITEYFSNLSVQLNYKVGGFTDTKILTVTAEQTTPGSTSSGVIIPDSNYNVYLNKSVPVRTAVYSAVIVEKTTTGFSVTGYDPSTPFFTIIPSVANNNAASLSVNDVSIKLYQESTNIAQVIPYGTEFATIQQVTDFLISYERYLVSQGFVFTTFDKDLNIQRDWTLSIREFLYWVQQGWSAGTIIVLNPVATKLKLNSVGEVVDEITNITNGSKLLDQNFLSIKSNDFTILRTENALTQNTFDVSTLSGKMITYAKLNLIQYEHVLIFDNVDDFNHIVYIPSQGTRQFRLKFSGYKTGAWTGALSAPGFIYNSPTINEWNSSLDYRLGDIVKYNNFYYTATQDIAASETFNSIVWTQIQKDDILTGLLPNFGLNARQFNTIYDIDNQPINENLQNYSASLIGFRQRQYLTDLGIGIPTQTKFYQGFIKEKGSLNAINALTKATFNNVNGNINVYEEWAFRTGLYGGINNNTYKEFVLDQSIFTTNPISFTSGSDYDAGNIIVVLNGNSTSTDPLTGNTNSNIYTASNLLSTSTTLYTNRVNDVYIRDIPTAGYVNLQDIDYTIFDIDSIAQTTIPIEKIGAGDKIWLAKNEVDEWEILRATETQLAATSLTYTLDSYGLLTFSGRHNFVANDIIVLKDFDTAFDGIYKVESVTNSTSIVITISSANPKFGQVSPLQKLIRALTITGSGIVYGLNSARVDTVTDLINQTPPKGGWTDHDHVWVNSTGQGWGVYTHTVPWHSNATTIISNRSTTNAKFGSVVRINTTNNNIYVGNPGSANVQVFSNTGAYITSIANAHASFGSAIATQGNLLAIGAPTASEVHIYIDNVYTQTLGSAGGNTVVVSEDRQWIYSGNVISNQVKAYTPGTVTYLNIGNLIVSPTLAIGDYITQSNSANYITANGTVVYSSVGNLIALRDVVGTFVSNVGNVQLAGFGNTMIARNGALIANANITSRTTSINYLLAATITGPADSMFGTALETDSIGSKLLISAPNATNTYSQNGNVYVYTRSGTTITLAQTLSSQHKNQSAKFGASLATDSTTANLYVGVPGSLASGNFNGLVERWTLSGSTYVFDQSIFHPNNEVGAFGSSLNVSDDAKLLAVGSQGSASQETTVFDNSYTTIDESTTQFVDYVINSGAVYLFEPLVDPLVTNTKGKYIFTQQLEAQVSSGDQYGYSIDLTRNIIVAGAPGANLSAGQVFLAKNNNASTAWILARQQQPKVDIDSISRTFIYNKSNNNMLAALDFIDPAKGKILNSVSQDIDYQLTKDPALYNQGKKTVSADLYWGPAQVGQVWWDLSTIRYIDYEQDALIYRLNHWGERFPGSSIDVYQWVESRVLPSQYTGSGTPLYADDSAYSTYGYVDTNRAVQIKYYFWVKNIDSAATSAGKNNSIVSITSAIENPQTQGIPYVEVLRNDTLTMYNVNNLLVGQNSVVHIGTTNGETNLIHSEYALVQEGNPYSTIPASILRKFADSLSGIDVVGNPVPDPALIPSQRYGIDIRPRQTMIMDRTTALSNYLTLINQYLINYPVVASKVLTTLNSNEPAPGVDSGEYDLVIDTVDQLNYINTTDKPAGYKVLINSDITQLGKWSIYSWTGSTWILATRTDNTAWVQNYKTNLYWDYADYYDYSAYDPTQITEITVANRLELGKLTLVAGQHIKVLDNGNNQFEVYLVDSTLNLFLVGIQNGTIQIKTTAIPGKELRQILLAMQTEIFVDDIASEYNIIFFAMIKYILTEQKNLDWVFKTSFIGATQQIRKLRQFPAYIPDNQNFYLDYINEVKPYRTVVREFVVDYVGDDIFAGDATDFDLPPYYDVSLAIYRSPNGSVSTDAAKLNTGIYSQWTNNYKYQVTNIIVETSGTGYVTPPQIVITGGGGTGATAYSVLNAAGGVASIVLTDPGSGYTSTPTVTINGTGSDASASVVLRNVYDSNTTGHNLVRSIETKVKFDRVNYTNPNTFLSWSTVTTANVGQTIAADTIINIENNLYKLVTPYVIDSAVTFPIANVTPISIADFNNANDRIAAYSPGINLKNIGEGLDYPGIQIDGNTYVGTYNDTNVQNYYTSNVGINPSDIIIDGGAYVDRYSSHAPEELVPGRMYDALNITVYDTNNLGIRIFNDMNLQPSYYRIAGANTTELSANLNLLDSNVYVINASVLPEPNPSNAVPGVVFINGEKITYYVRDTVNNRLGQIRRSVDGTGAMNIHLTGTRVIDSSIQQQIPRSVVNPLTLTANTGFKVTDTTYVTLGLNLTGNITGNIGDIIQQINANTNSIVGTFRLLQTVSNVKVIPVSLLSGTITGLGDVFDSALGFDVTGFDNTISPIYILDPITQANLATGSYVISPYVLANPTGNPRKININGTIYLEPQTRVDNGNVLYSPGAGLPSDGTGLINSTTTAAEFLKASRSFNVPPGTTP